MGFGNMAIQEQKKSYSRIEKKVVDRCEDIRVTMKKNMTESSGKPNSKYMLTKPQTIYQLNYT